MTGKERLRMLANFLRSNAEAIREHHLFDLHTWQNGSARGLLVDLPVPGDGVVTMPCGTTCCAAGFACMIPAFREQGLRMQKKFLGSEPAYNEAIGVKGLMEFFEISSVDVHWLFVPSSYNEWDDYPSKNDPLRVAERIESLITYKELQRYDA